MPPALIKRRSVSSKKLRFKEHSIFKAHSEKEGDLSRKSKRFVQQLAFYQFYFRSTE